MTIDYLVNKGASTFVVPKNHYFKFELLEGQQTLDVAIWSKENPKNKFLSMHNTLFRNGLFITKGSKLWSDYIIREVMMECVDETKYESIKDGWFHHLLAGYCDDGENMGHWGVSYLIGDTNLKSQKLAYKQKIRLLSQQKDRRVRSQYGLGSCKSNFLESIHEFGLYEENLNDNTINLFTKVKSKQNGFFQWAKSDAKVGDYITFKSRTDLIVSVSLCPGVDFPYFHHNKPFSKLSSVNPIKVAIYE